MFLAVWLIQALTRDGFDLTKHPLSLLALGDKGWVQVLNFVVCGSLFVAFAAGVRRTIGDGRGGTWVPLLFGVTGVGLIIAGLFTTDPGAGFPPGAPAGAPEQVSWHGVLHEVGFAMAQAWIVANVVLARRFAHARDRGWGWACYAAPVLVLTVDGLPQADSLPIRLVIGTAIQFTFVTALSVRLRRPLPNRASQGGVGV
ncbi:DUF998 domain-containing protein [Kribbella sp. NPDC003557]|uniref:DUF998 domain-containing protein n=1 Tax=Kribbella sp. NPDC003557 TaxID=3154449 RepID=UPI0033AA4851